MRSENLPRVLYVGVEGPNPFDPQTHYPNLDRELALLRSVAQVAEPLFVSVEGDHVVTVARQIEVDLAIVNGNGERSIIVGPHMSEFGLSTWGSGRGTWSQESRQIAWDVVDVLLEREVPVLYCYGVRGYLRAASSVRPFAPADLPEGYIVNSYEILEAIWRRMPEVADRMDWRRRIIAHDSRIFRKWAPYRTKYEWNRPSPLPTLRYPSPLIEPGARPSRLDHPEWAKDAWDADMHSDYVPDLPDDPAMWADEGCRQFWLEHHKGNPLWSGPYISDYRVSSRGRSLLSEEEHLRDMAKFSDKEYGALLAQFRKWASTHAYEWGAGNIVYPKSARRSRA
jgi:hypothetical protein